MQILLADDDTSVGGARCDAQFHGQSMHLRKSNLRLFICEGPGERRARYSVGRWQAGDIRSDSPRTRQLAAHAEEELLVCFHIL
jgi:hypothetical protein